MYALARISAVVLVVSLLTLGAVGLRIAFAPEDCQILLEESRRYEKLQQLQRATLRHGEALQHAAQEYIAQRCTLAEAMQRVQELEQELGREWPAYAPILRQPQPLPDDGRHYGIILAYVAAVLRSQPEELAAVRRRSEKDYQQLQAGRHRPAPVATEQIERNR